MTSYEDKFFNMLLTILTQIKHCVSKLQKSGVDMSQTNGYFLLIDTFIDFPDRKNVVETFVKYSFPYWDKIRLKEDQFFITNAADIINKITGFTINPSIFELIHKVNAAKDEPESAITDADRNMLFDLLGGCVKWSIRYTHKLIKENGTFISKLHNWTAEEWDDEVEKEISTIKFPHTEPDDDADAAWIEHLRRNDAFISSIQNWSPEEWDLQIKHWGLRLS